MTLLDRFRAQPRHKHPDVAVRLAYVAELPLEDREAILSMAREDAEPRVRRAAVAKVLDPQPLSEILKSDSDESVRARALEMLRDLALEAFEGAGEVEARAAVDTLTDPRTLGQIAKSSARDSIALRALAHVNDVRTLGSIARHAASEAARLDALRALSDRHELAEILAVALNGEHKDAAAGAVDLLQDRHELEQVAARSKNKNAIKRARILLREMEERAQEAQTPMSTDALLDSTTMPEVAASPAPAPDISDSERLEAARLEEESRQRVADEEEARRAQREAEAERARRAADDEAAARSAERQARLAQISDEAASAAELEDLSASRAKFVVLRQEWMAGEPVVDESVAARYADGESRLAAREAAAHEAEVRARREGLARMHNLLGRVEQLAAKPDVSLKAADRALRDIRAALSAIPPLPNKADHDDVLTRLKAMVETLTPKVNELRETDEWQKWANVTIQEQLCAKMEALNALEDPEAIAREVRELQQQWRAAADVPRDKADTLWRRFKSAHDVVWTRCETHFAEQAQVRAENLAKKILLCEQAESMAESTAWIQTADAIKKLQAEWKTIGPVSRGREKAIWDRFRTACDRFFTRRHDDLVQRKGIWAENLAKKDALSARVEALAESTDWDSAAVEIKRLQAEWKTVGPVKKSRSEAIWQRFRSACDRFFERYAQRHDQALAERVAAREAICAALEALAPGEDVTEQPADLLATVRGLRGKWQQEIAARGVDPERARALDARFGNAFSNLLTRWPAAFNGTDLDPDANRKRMEALVKKIEDLAASLNGPATASDANLSPADRLAAMLKEALAANTIGGKVEDDSRWRAAAEEVRQAQAAWSRLGPVPEAIRRQLVDRFQRASRKISERAESSARPGGGQVRPNRPPGGGAPRPSRDAAPEARREPVTSQN